MHVLEAAPYIRRALFAELRQAVVARLQLRYGSRRIEFDTSDSGDWFWITVSRERWASFQICLANWQNDGREIAIRVYHEDAKQLGSETCERIRENMATLRYTWHRTEHEDYVWNVWAEQSDWSTPGFLLRLVEEEERRTVASQIEQDVVAVVERMNETLVECPDSP